jgi:hypothetical protein
VVDVFLYSQRSGNLPNCLILGGAMALSVLAHRIFPSLQHSSTPS